MVDLDAIRARAEAATPGPWRAEQYDDCFIEPKICMIPANGCYDYKKFWGNSQFIAHAREDIPALLDYIDRITETERIECYATQQIEAERDALLEEVERLREALKGAQVIANQAGRIIRDAKWIPVGERLPKEYRHENGEPIEFNVLLPGANVAPTLCFDGSQWYEMDWKHMRTNGYYTVTHWMPLPAPPNTDEKEA